VRTELKVRAEISSLINQKNRSESDKKGLNFRHLSAKEVWNLGEILSNETERARLSCCFAQHFAQDVDVSRSGIADHHIAQT
jgi:hypothetical protein